MTDAFIVYKIGNIELQGCECSALIAENRIFLATYRTMYQLHYSANYGYYGTKVYYENGKLPLTKRGRFLAMSAEDANSMIGFELLVS